MTINNKIFPATAAPVGDFWHPLILPPNEEVLERSAPDCITMTATAQTLAVWLIQLLPASGVHRTAPDPISAAVDGSEPDEQAGSLDA